MSTSLQPRPHQVEALTDLTRAFAVHDRVQLVMACGTGKTLVGRWHAETTTAHLTVVFVPSLALVAQTLAEWRRAGRWGFDALVVCSDPTTSAGAAERADDPTDPHAGDVDDRVWDEQRAQVTTDHRKAARFLSATAPRPRVVFCTYHSAPVLAHAQAASRITFDLAICDEAHRLAGRPRPDFRVVLDRRQIVARHRLFMTATPKVFAATEDELLDADDPPLSMDDHRLFGAVAHEVSFRQAIDAGLLCDYQVLVVAERQDRDDADSGTTAPGAVIDAIDQHGATRLLTFHGRVAKAAAFATTIDGARTPRGRLIRARHVSGLMPADQRAETLRWLGEASDEIRLVANAKCLTEGIDVPTVDAILFADQRTNPVDIVQAVGRVLRRAPGKTIGSVIVPVALPSDGDDDSTLTTTAFAHVWTVLRGLRAHDERLADEIDHARRENAKSGLVGGWRPERIHFVLPAGVDEPALQLRLVEKVGTAWERYYGLLEDYATASAGKRITWGLKWRGVGVGMWAEDQRVAYRRGLLPTTRARRLEQIPGWAWDRNAAWWNDSADLVHAAADAYGGLVESETGDSILSGLRSADHKHQLGVWLAHQRQDYRDGVLDPLRAERLEQIPGFTWTPIPEQDLAMVDALRWYIDFEKHADVPEDHTEDGLPLGRWVRAVRRRKLTGRLHPALHDEIMAAAGYHGRIRMWNWETAETQWRLAYAAAHQYAQREGHSVISGTHREQLPDARVNVGQWVALQRFKYRRGELDEQHAGWLERLPGWVWDAPGVTKTAGDPIDLGDPSFHGRAKGSAAKCPCQPCLDYTRAAGRRSITKHRTIQDAVPAAAASHHLIELQQAINQAVAGDKRFERPPGATAIATAANVPVGMVRRLLKDQLGQITRTEQTAVLAVTLEQVLDLYDTLGSRGRLIMSSEEHIDAGPTKKLLEDLIDRGWNARWIARELGYKQFAVKIEREVVARRIARQVEDLHARVGPRISPTAGRHNARPPMLAEIEAAEQLEQAS